MNGRLPDPAFWGGKRVFLTGHTGFKGAWLALWLRRLGADVTGFALPPELPSLAEAAGVEQRITSIHGDIRDLPALGQAVQAAYPQIMLHLAAQALVRLSYRQPVGRETFATNVMGTAHVLEAARQAPTSGQDFAEAWNFGPMMDDMQSVSRVVQCLAQAWGDGAAWHVTDGPLPHEAGFLAVDPSLARRRLGWRPRLRLKPSFDWTSRWYKQYAVGMDAARLVDADIERYERLELLMTAKTCRFCQAPLHESFADLGMTPLSNSFIAPDKACAMEPFYPLHAYVCSTCRLVQLEEFESSRHIFGDYIYFSSYSESWLRHAEAYAAKMAQRLGLGTDALVVEIASNDGYLLQYFQQRGIQVLGVEPAANVAAAAAKKGIPTEIAFFGRATATQLRERGIAPDLMTANNVLAHVPDINDFVGGLTILLKSEGVVTVEFPHLLRLLKESQFDTIYHEHFSYLSLHVVQRIFARHGLLVFDVEQLPTHGGSLRVFACHAAAAHHSETPTVARLLTEEVAAGLEGDDAYRRFARQIAEAKSALLRFLIDAQAQGKRVAAYGAPAKGNTLLNYCGVGPDLIAFTVDRSPHKQGMLLPGTRIPIRAPEAILEEKPDYVLVLPWNLQEEITAQMAAVRAWGGRFVVPIPTTRVLP